MIRIKICGITSREDALAAVGCGADALGFVFAPSPRQVTPNQARDIIASLPPTVTAVGVFADEPHRRVRGIALRCHLDVLQLHGNEPPAYCRDFDHKVIKAFRVQGESIVREVAAYDVDACLLDSPTGGGTGLAFDWGLIDGIEGRIILAGGLRPDNVAEAIQKVRPYAVDVSTGVESVPGKKDPRLMEAFVRQVRQSDRGSGGRACRRPPGETQTFL
jgi:phosphoribosylanthranilate isomerase